MGASVGQQGEIVFEYIPEPTPASRATAGAATPSGARGGATTAASGAAREGVDTTGVPVRDAFSAANAKEAAAGEENQAPKPRRREYEAMGATPGKGFEPPEQRFLRLQAEVAELLKLAEKSKEDAPAAGAELLGADPSSMAAELRVLEQRLGGLAREGPPAWRGAANEAGAIPSTMSGTLVSQLERFAGGSGGATTGAADGRVTYEISYAPSAGAIADSAKLAALEGTVADIERQLGVLEPTCPFPDLQTAVTHLQKRLSLLDNHKLEAISGNVKKVNEEMDGLLKKKAELEGAPGQDKEIDLKVSQLYEFCHRWSATSASLPAIVARLQALQALHQQSASFTSRLAALEQQQDELSKLLRTTNSAVLELQKGLQDNMTIVKDNMKTLEEKMSKALH